MKKLVEFIYEVKVEVFLLKKWNWRVVLHYLFLIFTLVFLWSTPCPPFMYSPFYLIKFLLFLLGIVVSTSKYWYFHKISLKKSLSFLTKIHLMKSNSCWIFERVGLMMGLCILTSYTIIKEHYILRVCQTMYKNVKYYGDWLE